MKAALAAQELEHLRKEQLEQDRRKGEQVEALTAFKKERSKLADLRAQVQAEVETLREENKTLDEKSRILREFVAAAGVDEAAADGAPQLPERTKEDVEQELAKLKKLVARERKAIEGLEKEAAKGAQEYERVKEKFEAMTMEADALHMRQAKFK